MAQMTAEDYLHVALYTALGVLYLVSCVRLALWHSRRGRSFWLWLAVTFFLTAIPTMFVIWRRGRRRPPAARSGGRREAQRSSPAGGPRRCPHCGRLVVAPDTDAGGALTICPHCGLPIGEAPSA